MNKEKEINEHILIQYMKNELNEDEYIEVEEWINKSAENKKMADDCFYLSWAIETLQEQKNGVPEQALDKVNRHLRKKKHQNFIRHLQRIAAVLILPLCLFTGYLWINTDTEVPTRYLETRMAPGMVGSMILPDGTKVWLNSSSYLKYPTEFQEDKREIYLDGEAYFEVTEDKLKPFVVQTKQSSVTVLGTSFNVDAYNSASSVTTTLIEGSVNFTYHNEYAKPISRVMKPNEQLVYNTETHKTVSQETYLPKDIAWIKGQIVLRNTPLAEVLWMLNKRFNAEFTIKDPAFYNHSFTGVFTNQQIERVLEHFHRSSDIKYKITYHHNSDGEIEKTKVELF